MGRTLLTTRSLPFIMSIILVLSSALDAASQESQFCSGSIVFTADTTGAYQSSFNNKIIGVRIDIEGAGDALSLISMNIDASLCTNFSNDVSLVNVYYTAADSVFSMGNLFWSGQQPYLPITGVQELQTGKNYFWLCYNLSPWAVVNDILDAACTGFTLTDNMGSHIPSVTSPPGYRLVISNIVLPRSISGRLYYDNTAQTGLGNVVVLLNSGYVQQQVVTNNTGVFQFNNLPPGTYYLLPVCVKPWGGVNAVDALTILRHFVGLNTLSYMGRLAADVDMSSYINATDAMLVLKRFTGVISDFPVGDWVFEPIEIEVDGTADVVRDIRGLCTGDANRNYLPAK